jgi:hypothetical protein
MKSKRYVAAILFVAGALFLTACSGNKGPATTAVNAALDSYKAVRADALQYIPEQAKSVEDALTAAKASLDKGDYDAALNGAKGIPDTVKGFAEPIAAKKAEMTAAWKDMSGGVGEMVDTLQKKIITLMSAKGGSMDPAKLDTVRSSYDAAVKAWEDAQSAASAGAMGDAVAQGKVAQDKATSVMTDLGMKVPAPPKKKG